MCRDNNHSRPADVLVEDWERGQPAALDITVTSPLTPVSLKDSSRIAGVAALSAETRKHAANDPKCRELGWICIPMAVETYGNWGKEAQHMFSRLATYLAIHLSCPKSRVLAGCLNICLVRAVARAILGRGLSPIHLQCIIFLVAIVLVVRLYMEFNFFICIHFWCNNNINCGCWGSEARQH